MSGDIMPKCKKCEKSFPNRIVIDGKARNLQKRKYCFECSPFGKHNTAQLHITKHEKERFCVCPECGREYIYDEKKGHTLTRCNSCAVNKRKMRVKKKALDYKGGKCAICDYDKCIEALEFHHKDPSKKEFSLSGCHCLSWERVVKELNKCILLCCRCHREFHSGLIDL